MEITNDAEPDFSNARTLNFCELKDEDVHSMRTSIFNDVYGVTTVKGNPTWWKRRSGLERGLTVIAVSGFLLCIALAVALGILAANTTCNTTSRTDTANVEMLPSTAEALSGSETSKNAIPKGAKCNDVCLTSGCVHTASKILKNLNPDVEPCDDFYKFACGSFIESTIIPDDKTSVNTFSIIVDDLEEQLRLSIEEESLPNEPKPFRLVKNLYKACMNKTLIEERGLTPLLDDLRKLGGWPVLDGARWNEGDFTWKDSVYRFRRQGYSVDYFIDFGVSVDLKNNSRRLIDLDQAALGLSREYLSKGFNDKIVQAYYKYMVDIAVILGANPSRAQAELKESLEFEIKLANISLPNEKRRNVTLLYNPMTVNQLSAAYPSIPWWEYFNTILAPQAQLQQDEIVIVNVPSYLKDFEKLITTTPKRVQANYALWRATAASVSYLTDDIRKRQLKYTVELNGKTEREPRWKECVDIVSGSMGISVGSMYVRKYFKEDAKNAALEMVDDIRQEFIKILKKVDWMDEKTRANALEKAAGMASHIAYPNELLDDRKLEKFYEGLELSADDYVGSIFNLSMFGTNFSFGRLRQPVNKTEWISHARPAIVNAFYSSIENSIQFPAGILQGAFFSNDRPRYMNYGAIGFVIGHEITHGFDDQGRQFNKEGNLVDWWQSETKKRYLKKAECIIHQYGNYTVKDVGLNLNGINTQGENIADNGGIKEAYFAYREWVKRNKPEPRLPGLPYSPEQLFWISAANSWCSKYRPEAMKLRITTGFHSPSEFRVRGPLSNMEEFSRDFNCPVGSRMNPEKKCTVW
ncbi:PREDICTED: membrane metallo-endopeptidase-like 1 isoform X1 [Vollenhovia emeryi]|uniref:membrane metallo-endopeptidase-like 1 isoform X1 n=1 Tax=Vollenhovia emeryi TaxID=411798 RepID=UPI0005F47406|nr:PREDICTED: membrane metallo-endopeptidase-like 1 isoform X1 [Vollenhovia emeryi]